MDQKVLTISDIQHNVSKRLFPVSISANNTDVDVVINIPKGYSTLEAIGIQYGDATTGDLVDETFFSQPLMIDGREWFPENWNMRALYAGKGVTPCARFWCERIALDCNGGTTLKGKVKVNSGSFSAFDFYFVLLLSNRTND